jgi:acetyltransferase
MGDRNAVELARRPYAGKLPSGEAIVVRTIASEDAGRLRGYFAGLSAQSRRNRFLGAVNQLPAAVFERIWDSDRAGRLGLIAVAGGRHDGAIIAESILVMAPNGERGEFGLSVADDWQRRGLGTLLLRDAECRARVLGARSLFGEVLRTNTVMTHLARFSIRSPFTDARLIEVVNDLSMPQRGLPCYEQLRESPAIAA